MNNLLTKRLEAIANLVDDGKVVYDVGCDHAYLDIYLNKERLMKCYAIDNRPNVVKIAEDNVKKYNASIPVILNNGINNIELEKNSVIVLAGMGTRNIIKIIENKNIEQMILQSNDDLYELRKYLSNNGYKIIDEVVVFEFGYYYVLIKCQQGSANYSEEELFLGPILMNKKDRLYIQYLEFLIKRYDKMISTIPTNFPDNIIKYKKIQDTIKEYVNKIKMAKE